MIKRILKTAMMLCMIAALVLTPAAHAEDETGLIGTWECTNFRDIVIDNILIRGISREQAETTLEQYPDTGFTLTVNADGTGVLHINTLGTVGDATGIWSPTATGIMFAAKGYNNEVFHWDGDNLLNKALGHTLIFQKTENINPPVGTVSAAPEAGPEDPAGTWKPINYTDVMICNIKTRGYSEKQAEDMIAQSGEPVFTMTLNRDGTGTLCTGNGSVTTEENITWSADDGAVTIYSIDFGDSSIFYRDGGRLLCGYNGMAVIFFKTENTAPEAGQ